MLKNLLLAFFLIFALTVGHAQKVHHIKEVTVEAKAKTDAIEQQKESTPAKIVISSKELNNYGNHSVGDILKRLPRIFVQGPPSFNRNIMMGGLDKQFQSVLINGNRPAGGEDYRDLKLDRIPVEMVEEVEIIYNPPAEWGADAAMGVVNIKLKDAPDEKYFNANIALDHTSTKGSLNPDMSVTFGNSYEKLSFIASYSYNQFNRINLNTLSDGEISGTELDDINVKIHGFTGSLNYELNKNSKLKFETFYSDYNETLDFVADIKHRSDGSLNFTSDTASDTKIRRLHTQTLSYETKGSDWRWTNSLNFSQHFDKKDRWRLTAKSSGLTETLEDEDQQNSESVFRSDYRKILNKQTLKLGVRASGLWRDYSRMVYTKIHGNMFWDDITDGSYDLSEYRASAYATDEILLNKWQVVPSLRLDYDTRSYETIDDKGDFTYTSFNPSLHTKYQHNDKLFFKADVARQISRPPFNAQVPIDKIKHKKSTIERGNKDLLPSEAYTMGAGVEKYFENNSYITFRGFYSVMRDVIEKKNVGIDDNTGYQVIQSVNVDSGLIWGLDVDLHLILLSYKKNELTLNSNLSWLGSEVRDASTSELRRLNEQPEYMTNSSLDYFNSGLKLQFSLGVNHVGNRYIAGGTDEGTLIDAQVYQPYTQWDARLKYFFKPWGSVYVNAVNLFNEKIEIKQGAVTESEIVGRNIRVGLSFTL
ncbi:TonB-dependent receptor plug domain-containing protein [Labilibacter marinus]|uniref:TonB-dependent receptor plug domain-containing protein n=1 Tax=Labilibacter marinus TaxID=1477105 RepID=UPI00094F60D8|nr:TonB-dependent receptor [Labilibacter marinus]